INNQAWVTALAEETKVEAHSSALVEYSVWIRKESYTNEHASYTTLEDGRIRWELRLWDVPLAGKIITDILGQYPNQKYVGDIEIMVADGHITKIQGGGVQSSYSTSVEFTIPTAGLTDRFVYTFAQTYRSNWYALQGFPDWDEDFIPTYATIVYYTQVDFDNYIQNGYYGNELHIGTIPYLTQKTFIQDPGNDDFSLHKGYEVIEEGGQEYLLYKVKANIGGAWGGTQNIYFIDDLERRVSWYNNEGTKNWGSQEISHSLTKDFQMVIKRADNGAVLVDYSLPDIPVAGTSVWVPTNAKDPLPDGVISRFYLKAYNPNPGKIQIQCQMNAIEGVTTGSMWPFNCDTVVEITYKVPLNAPTVGDPKYISDYYLGRGGTTLKPTLQDVAESWANGEYTDKVYNNMRAYTFTEPKGNLLSSDCYFNRGKKLTKNMIDKGGNIAGFSIVVNQEGKYYAIGVPTYNIVDTMSSNLNILMDTLKIYAISGGKWVDKTDLLNNDPLWAVSFSKLPDSKETEIVFMVPDGVPIKIEYDTYVQGTSGQPSNVYNRVDIAGVSSIEYKDIFLVTQSGASAGGERMQVTTTKYDSELESLLLSGAEFDLYMNAVPTGTPETMMIDGVKFYKIDSDVTDSFGKIVFDNQALTSNIEKIFAIVEVNPPEGYQKDGDGITLFSFNSDEDYNGRPVIWILNNINIGNTASDPEPVPIPQPLRVYKVDVDDDTPLEGAVFELYMALETGEKYEGYDSLSDPPAPVVVGGKVFYYVQTATSTSPDGIALFDSEMIAPEYEAVFLIRETAAPDGYILPESQSERDKFIIIHSLSGEDTDALQFELSREVEFVVDGFFVHNKLEPVIEVHERSLPETGGKGTVLFTLAGILLMLAAIMIVVIRRNRSNGKK
ncbi:MAG: LPXTG cell wall anchor domain-containing protein, partial [Oscillospiraceae bacterium]|nr:LPXTG cell wall anchor domain-containing protein [Oscillospiraceae bacterium]